MAQSTRLCVYRLHVFRRKPRFYTAWNTLVAEQIVVLSCSCVADVRNCSYLSGTDDTVVAEGEGDSFRIEASFALKNTNGAAIRAEF